MLGGDRAGGKGVCGRLMSPAQETQSMREIRLLRGRLPRKGGGLTGMMTTKILAYPLILNENDYLYNMICYVYFIDGTQIHCVLFYLHVYSSLFSENLFRPCIYLKKTNLNMAAIVL